MIEQKRILTVVGTLVVLVLIAAALKLTLFRPDVAGENERPLDLPVKRPEITNMQQVIEMNRGKPLPRPLLGMVLPPVDTDDHVYGDINAPVSIVEYSNYGNAYAPLLHPELRTFIRQSNGAVNWVFRHFPLAEEQYAPAQAAECAYRQGGHDAFWTYFDAFIAVKETTKEMLVDAAVDQNLDKNDFTDCLDDALTRERVVTSMQRGIDEAKIENTPSYIVIHHASGDMRLVEGIVPMDYIAQVIAEVD